MCVHGCPSANDYKTFICKTDADQTTADNSIAAGYVLVNDNYRCFFKLKSKPGKYLFIYLLKLYNKIK